VGASFAGEVSAALSVDELLYSDSTPLAWTQTKLSTDADAADAAGAGLLDLLDDATAAAGDMSFSLPACPSAAVLQASSRACWVSGLGWSDMHGRIFNGQSRQGDTVPTILYLLHGSIHWQLTMTGLPYEMTLGIAHAHTRRQRGHHVGIFDWQHFLAAACGRIAPGSPEAVIQHALHSSTICSIAFQHRTPAVVIRSQRLKLPRLSTKTSGE
jgi:hypothetical protein